MAKLTLLEMVQDILSDMDSDEVNSINDTLEATQVAQIIRTTYFESISNRKYPHLKSLTTLTALADSEKPTHTRLPDTIQDIDWIKYNKRTATDLYDKYSEVMYLDPEDFLERLNSRKSSDSDVKQVVDISGVTINIKTDTAPTYWSSFDDEHIIFDSYDSEVDSTIQSSKIQVWALREPSFSMTDTFIPDMPSKVFPFLLSEAKSVAFNALRQSANAKEEQRSRRQRIWLARDKWRENGGMNFPNYGRNV